MNEADIVANTTTVIRKIVPTAVVFKHSDMLVFGIPDVSVNFNDKTSWWEFKFERADKPFELGPNQEPTCRKLAIVGTCFFVVYDDPSNTLFIVEPRNIRQWRKFYHYAIEGTDYHELAKFMLQRHAI